MENLLALFGFVAALTLCAGIVLFVYKKCFSTDRISGSSKAAEKGLNECSILLDNSREVGARIKYIAGAAKQDILDANQYLDSPAAQVPLPQSKAEKEQDKQEDQKDQEDEQRQKKLIADTKLLIIAGISTDASDLVKRASPKLGF